ncbi:MAG: MFS transporter [Promethearchaeota archaeon]
MPVESSTSASREWSRQDKLTLIVLLLLSIASSAAAAILPPMAKIIAPQLGVPSDDWIGLVVTSYLLISGVMAIPWAYVADRTTRRTLLLFNTFFWVLCFVPLLLPNNTYLTLLLSYSVAAIGVGATGPLGLSMMIDCVPTHWRSTSFGLLATTAGAGYGLGFMTSGLLTETFGWQAPVLLITVIGFGTGLLLFLIREPPRGQYDASLADLHSSGGAYTHRINREDLRRMWQRRSNIWLVLVGIIAIIPTAAYANWAVQWLIVDHGFSLVVATQFLILALLSQTVGNLVLGRLGDRLFLKDKLGRVKVLLVCCLCAGPTLLLTCFYSFTVAPTATIFDVLFNPAIFSFFLLISVGAFFDAAITPLIYTTAGEVNPPEIRSTAMSIHLLAHTIGVALGTQLAPSITVLLYGGIYSPSLFGIYLLFFVGAILVLPILYHIKADIGAVDEELRERVGSP